MGKKSYNPKSMRPKDKVRVALTIIVIIALMGTALFCLHRWESAQQGTENRTDRTQEVWSVDGVDYVEKENIDTYLFMGIDVTGPAKASNSYIGTGQCDTLLLAIVNHDEQTWQILEINRETMCDVPVLGVKGDVLSTEYEQIELAHSYGDGLKKSCNNTVDAVSGLLHNIQIDGYYSLNMDGLALINDALGGVEVDVTTDLSSVDEALVPGAHLTLTGEQAMHFVRSRYGVEDESNVMRMARQQEYLNGLLKKLPEQTNESLSKVLETASDYSVTNIGSQTLVDLLEDMQNYTHLENAQIEGDSFVEDDSWVFYPDEKSLQQLTLDLFFDPVS
jgi:LCP family protein required for cell wall assembly